MTLQMALTPHVPSHGLMHLLREHIWLTGHSAFTTHSGRQFGGDPMKLYAHEQDGDPFIFLHAEFNPHGVGLHGSLTSSCTI